MAINIHIADGSGKVTGDIMRKIIPINFGWDFTENFNRAFSLGEGRAVRVDLPHTCKITPFSYFDESVYQMDCGYRKMITIPAEAEGRRTFLKVGAAAHRAQVYVGGKAVGKEHLCGYTAFEVELTPYIVPGKPALVSIECDSREAQNIPPFGHVVDYMTYGGLYRDVQLEIRENSHITSVFAMPETNGRIISLTETQGDFDFIRQTLYDNNTKLCEGIFTPGQTCALWADNIELWSCDTPKLYRLQTELISSGAAIDLVSDRIGFRSAVFKSDGFYLNGKKLRLTGLNRHQSFPFVGYAMPASMQRFDAEILKNELGLNAVRTSHYPQSKHFIDRCDELGLLVFTEIPGWQYIGDENWKAVSVNTAEEMVRQYRSHPSVILWGVRINESRDDDEFYRRTNDAAHRLDPTRQTGGVRCHKKSSLLEDVYTYNDFVHDGSNKGCEPKSAVTSDMNKAYLISEYNGHMFPTKSFDCEEHRLEHALRHASVLDSVRRHNDIAGSFGWCFADYNTHKDFGSGDRICYHGVCDMFRNKKLAAEVYASFSDKAPVLALSSSMDIGEHPAGNRGRVFAFTNADILRVYHNNTLIHEYTRRDSRFSHLPHPPIEIDDYVGDKIARNENFSPRQASYVKDIINDSARFGMGGMTLKNKLKAGWLVIRYGMTFHQAYALYSKYIGNWGSDASAYTFEAVKNGRIVRRVIKEPFRTLVISAEASSLTLTEADTYDVAEIRIRMTDQNGNTLPFYNGAVKARLEGPAEMIGEAPTVIRGGCGGIYIKTIGKSGNVRLTLSAEGAGDAVLSFTVTKEREAYHD